MFGPFVLSLPERNGCKQVRAVLFEVNLSVPANHGQLEPLPLCFDPLKQSPYGAYVEREIHFRELKRKTKPTFCVPAAAERSNRASPQKWMKPEERNAPIP